MPSRALLTEVQTISNAEIVQALANIKIVATSGITSTFPATASTLAGLSVANTFTANQAFSGTINLVATTSTAGQITQGGERFIHTFQPSGQNQNVFIGFQAGRTSVMTGGGNVGIGRAALQSLTGGANNLAFGDAAAYTLTSGSSNIIIGASAGNAITGGSTNCAVGVGSMASLTTTSDNCAFGHQALGLQTGAQNVGVGKNAGYSSTSNNGTYIGQTAGFATATVGGLVGVAITTGANNTMLGQASSSTSATGTYRTAIGSDSRCESNNAIKLGRDTLDVVLLPKMTQAEMATAAATLSAVKGALVYCLDGGAAADHVHFYNGSSWARLN